jgi:hypothetical protein
MIMENKHNFLTNQNEVFLLYLYLDRVCLFYISIGEFLWNTCTGDRKRYNSESRHPKDNRVSKYEQFDFHEVVQLFSS